MSEADDIYVYIPSHFPATRIFGEHVGLLDYQSPYVIDDLVRSNILSSDIWQMLYNVIVHCIMYDLSYAKLRHGFDILDHNHAIDFQFNPNTIGVWGDSVILTSSVIDFSLKIIISIRETGLLGKEGKTTPDFQVYPLILFRKNPIIDIPDTLNIKSASLYMKV